MNDREKRIREIRKDIMKHRIQMGINKIKIMALDIKIAWIEFKRSMVLALLGLLQQR